MVASLPMPEALECFGLRMAQGIFDEHPAPLSSLVPKSINFQLSHQLTPFVYLASGTATSAWPSACQCYRVRQLQFSGIFIALFFVGDGVITVMINSP